MESKDILNLGVLGRFYSARNVLGFYRLINVLAVSTYSTEGLSDPDSWFTERFSQALYQTVHSHPSLCYGVVDQTTEREAVFLRLPAIYRDEIVVYCGQDPPDPGEKDDDDKSIEALLERWHAQIITDGHRKPAWRVVVFKHGSQWGSGVNQKSPRRQKVSIAFLANHAIADGLSQVNFHRTLFRFFNQPDGGVCIWPYIVPRDLQCPILMENVIDLLAKDYNDTRQVSYDTTLLWSGENLFMPSIEEYKCGVRIVTVPLLKMKSVMSFCRSKQVTLTGLLHGLVVTYISRAVPPGHALRAVTPYSMRHVTKASEYEICNHASAILNDFPAPLTTAIHDTPEDSAEELQLIIEIAEMFGRDIQAELKRTPKNNIWAALFGDIDWYAQAGAQLGNRRPLTYELPNLGNLKMFETPELQETSSLKLEKVVGSQSGSVTGPVVLVNCLSIQGGPFTATLTWQKGSCEEQFINGMAAYLGRRLEEGFGQGIQT